MATCLTDTRRVSDPLPANLCCRRAADGSHLPPEARSFEYAPPTIQVNQGDRLTIELSSTDVVHGLYIDGYDLDVVADWGKRRNSLSSLINRARFVFVVR